MGIGYSRRRSVILFGPQVVVKLMLLINWWRYLRLARFDIDSSSIANAHIPDASRKYRVFRAQLMQHLL